MHQERPSVCLALMAGVMDSGMRDWEDRMKAAGAEVACGEGIITQETPDDDALVKCKELGKTLAAV